MGLLIDSFWRAAAYCIRPYVIALSLLPLLLIALMAWGAGHFWWAAAVSGVQNALQASDWLGLLWSGLRAIGMDDAPAAVAPLLVVIGATPIIVLIAVMAVAMLMTPALVRMVARRRFPVLAQKKGGSFFASLAWSLGSMFAAFVALLLSVPLWLVPPLILVLPPLIWGWLTYRVMAFDALADHASKEERIAIFQRHRMRLLGMGILCGYLGAAPGIVWASGVLFAAAFVFLVPAAIWIYTLVFAFSSLWFTHYALAALEQLRNERGERGEGGDFAAAPAIPASPLQPASLPPTAT
ncbi:EI24 domain-containing protein [Acidovorax sp. NCPPB 4044]|uniref:EI24 domain-containing protein n=1 Tax=Acidovorax sp. NCPPB 4044 TaxID=2940490 RepID=UPI0023031243|nr:EI24 domain-containing protein [Acidovorax sp. NCPPB 4044]MDA8519969.1 EI24 domain-containing protein [Acidovorax sp. NCPPB 4044]